MKNRRTTIGRRHCLAAAVLVTLVSGGAAAQDTVKLSFMNYVDGNEDVVFQELIDRFEAENPGVEIEQNVVAFDVVRDQLESQLQAGTGPDIARVVALGALNPYYLDLKPYVDAAGS